MWEEPLSRGIRLFNQCEFFESHEALEEVWTPARGPRRLFLQSLIHLAVGFYHCERGNPEGAKRQLRKGLRKLAGYLPECEGIATWQLYREALAVLEQVEAGVPVSVYPRIDPLAYARSAGSEPRRER